jgi:hypothetical protein
VGGRKKAGAHLLGEVLDPEALAFLVSDRHPDEDLVQLCRKKRGWVLAEEGEERPPGWMGDGGDDGDARCAPWP